MTDTLNKIQKIQNLTKQTFSLGKSLNLLKASIDLNLKNYSRTFLKNKIHLIEYFDNSQDANIKYKISKKTLKSLEFYSDPFIEILRSNQNLVYKILTHCNTPSSKEQISSLIGNMFYDNIYSKNPLDSEYLIVLTRIILKEVHSLKNIESIHTLKSFLNQSIFDYLIRTFHRNDEVRDYFKKILKYALIYIDNRENGNVLYFDSEKLAEVYETSYKTNQLDEEIERKKLENFAFQKMVEGNKSSLLEDAMTTRIGIRKDCLWDEKREKPLMTEETFMNNYAANLEIDDMKKQLDDMHDCPIKSFYIKNIDYASSEQIDFSNKKLVEQVYQYDVPHKILQIYRINFSIAVQIIEDIIFKLKTFINIIPPSIKYLCKITELALRRNFPDIKEIEIYSYVGKLFFEKIMGPIFQSPHIYGIINLSVILDSTKETTEIIMTILNKFASMFLFSSQTETTYTFFNWFILKRIDSILNFFFELLETTKLPPIIMKIISNYNSPSGEEPFDIGSYVYNYFDENKEEHIRKICVFYSAEQLYEILNVLKENPKILENAKIKENPQYTRLKMSVEKMQEKINVLENEIEISLSKNIRMFRMKIIDQQSELIKKLEELHKRKYHPINMNGVQNKSFSQEENDSIKSAKISLVDMLNSLINLKDCYFINEEDITETNDFLKFVKEMITFNSMALDNQIQIKWNMITFKEQIRNIPTIYKKNDNNLLYSELLYEIETNINDINSFFIGLSQLNETSKYLEKKANETKKTLDVFKEGVLNSEIKHFIQKEEIPISFVFIEKNGKNKFIIEFKQRKNCIFCKTIQQFCNDFPKLWKLYNFNKHDIILKCKEFEVAEALNDYYDRIKKKLLKQYDYYNFGEYEQVFIDESMRKEKLIEEQEEETKKQEIVSEDEDSNEEFKGRSKEKKLSIKKINLEDKQKEYKMKARQKVLNLVFSTIKNFILNRIYDRIHPGEMTKEDELFFLNVTALHFVEPRHFDTEKKLPNIHVENILEVSKETINRVESARTPQQKIYLLNDVYQFLIQKFHYETGKFVGCEDMLPFFFYIFIKSSPKTIITDLNFIEEYGREFLSESLGHLFSTVRLMVTKILSYDHMKYKNICTIGEFDEIFFEDEKNINK